MKYIAHIRDNPDSREKNSASDFEHAADSELQSVKEHLEGTAKIASDFSIPLLKNIMYDSGLMHDIGKYQKTFQERIRGAAIRVDHSTCGAIEAEKTFDYPASLTMEYIIAGHHSGIPDGGTVTDIDNGTLSARLNKENLEPYQEYKNEIKIKDLSDDNEKIISSLSEHLSADSENNQEREVKQLIDEYAFFVRYCYSCLVDADSLDTELFCQNIKRTTLKSDYKLCLDRLDKQFEKFSKVKNMTELQKARQVVQQQAFKNINKDADIYLMNMPTGSGKTLCSAKCALMKAIAENKKHIIYIIPYNSIITQTAKEFDRIFNDNSDGNDTKAANILRHQSTYSVEDDENADDSYKVHVNEATENWDADFIITTAVQFFETVFSNRRSKLRKLHNMADSVLIFDEAHLMPAEYFQPCLESIVYLTKMFGSKAILLTATMPDYRFFFNQYTLENLDIVDLIPDKSDFDKFDKCNFVNLGKITLPTLVMKAHQSSSSLIVVGSRQRARDIYEAMDGDNHSNVYHLSILMTKFDIQNTIDEINNKLYQRGSLPEDEEPLIVVSTSLIEAGVDLDFSTAFRECSNHTGLDNIIQTGGRCNREGKQKKGNVFIFELDKDNDNETVKDIRTAVTENLLSADEYNNVSDPECVKEYYRRVYGSNDAELTRNSMHEFMYRAGLPMSFDSIPFRSYDQKCNIINTMDESVIIVENEEAEHLVNTMRFAGISRKAMRKVQKYTCSVPPAMMEELFQQGVLENIVNYEDKKKDNKSGIYVLTNIDYYSCTTGIQSTGGDYFI